MKLSEIDDCSICPLPGEGLCPGGMVCYGGEPIEPPCTSWDGDEDVEDYIESVHASILEREEYEDRLREEREKKKRKNEIAKRKRQYLNIYCYSEKHDVKSLKKQIKSYESIESEIPDVDYGYDYEKDVALAFMYRVEGIVALANRLAEECADG